MEWTSKIGSPERVDSVVEGSPLKGPVWEGTVGHKGKHIASSLVINYNRSIIWPSRSPVPGTDGISVDVGIVDHVVDVYEQFDLISKVVI